MPRPWSDKFRDAFRGLRLAICRERSFVVHLPMAVAVAVCGAANAASEVNKLTVTADAAGDMVFTDTNNPITDGDGPGGQMAAPEGAE